MNWRFLVSDKNVRKFEDLPIYCKRYDCSPGILVSSKLRFMWIRGGLLERGRQMSGVVVNGDFSLFSLAISYEPSHSRPQLLYCIM